MPLSSSQKTALTQFVNFTQIDKRTAERTLKAHNWNVQQAIDEYFANPSKNQPSTETLNALNKLFDKYRESPEENSDTVGIDGTMSYLKDLQISIEDIGVLVISDIVASPTLGEMTRSGFVNGWSPYRATSTAAQKTAVNGIVSEFARLESRAQGGVFRRVYKHTFKIACPPGSRSLPLEMALEYWKLLFGPQGVEWRTKNSAGKDMAWLEWWMTFLQERWKKAVTRDLWEQTLLFAEKTREDASMSWWSEESAWPGVIDEFVGWAKEKQSQTG